MPSRTVPDTPPESASPLSKTLAFLLLVASLIACGVANRALLAFGDSASSQLRGTDQLFFDPNTSSPELIYFLTAVLLVARWPRLRASFRRGSAPAFSLILLLTGSTLTSWAQYTEQPQLQIPAVATLLVGLAAGFCGYAGARIMLFPAAFLLLAFPIPRVLVNQVMYPLQLANAASATQTLQLLGVDAVQSGEIIAIPGRAFQVIESCSGLRGIVTILMAAGFSLDLFARRGPRAATLVLAAPVIAVVMNHLRILSVIANPYATDEAIHALQGVVMIVVGVLSLAGLDRLLDRWSLVPNPPRKPVVALQSRSTGWLGPIVATAVLVSTAAFTLRLEPWVPDYERAPEVNSFPLSMTPWTAPALLPVDRKFLGSVAFDRCTRREYARRISPSASPSDPIELLLCSDSRSEGGNRMLSRKLWSPGAGWSITPWGHFDLAGWDGPIDLSLARRGAETQLVAHWRAGSRNPAIEILRGTLGLDRGPFRRPTRAMAVRVSTPLEPTDPDPAGAVKRLVAFLELSRNEFERLGALRSSAPPGRGGRSS